MTTIMVALLSLLLVSWGYGAALEQGSRGEDDALSIVRTFVKANETANLDLIVSTFDDSATVFFPGEPPQRASGKAEIRNVFAALFKQRKGPITITPRDVNLQEFGDVSIVTAHLVPLPAGPVLEPTVFPRRTFVLRRVGRSWLIVHHHASNVVVMPVQK